MDVTVARRFSEELRTNRNPVHTFLQDAVSAFRDSGTQLSQMATDDSVKGDTLAIFALLLSLTARHAPTSFEYQQRLLRAVRNGTVGALLELLGHQSSAWMADMQERAVLTVERPFVWEAYFRFGPEAQMGLHICRTLSPTGAIFLEPPLAKPSLFRDRMVHIGRTLGITNPTWLALLQDNILENTKTFLHSFYRSGQASRERVEVRPETRQTGVLSSSDQTFAFDPLWKARVLIPETGDCYPDDFFEDLALVIPSIDYFVNCGLLYKHRSSIPTETYNRVKQASDAVLKAAFLVLDDVFRVVMQVSTDVFGHLDPTLVSALQRIPGDGPAPKYLNEYLRMNADLHMYGSHQKTFAGHPHSEQDALMAIDQGIRSNFSRYLDLSHSVTRENCPLQYAFFEQNEEITETNCNLHDLAFRYLRHEGAIFLPRCADENLLRYLGQSPHLHFIQHGLQAICFGFLARLQSIYIARCDPTPERKEQAVDKK